MCANQQVCPDVKEMLKTIGFQFLKETPNSSDSDLIVVKEIAREQIQDNGEKILKICGDKVQQISVSVF